MGGAMSGPDPSARFRDRLDWLLRSVPRQPGSTERYDLDDLLGVLAMPGAFDTRTTTRGDARSWLVAMRDGRADATEPRSRRYLAILEDLFRLPTGYFHDENTQRATDERILFAQDAAERGVTVIGPCRVRGSVLGIEGLHALHRQARDQLDRRAGA